MRERYVWRDDKWLRVDPNRKPRPRVHIISDYHDPFKSMADGKMYDSKSAYRADLKARGMVELGSDMIEPAATYDPGDIAGDIADVMNGNVPIEGGVEAPDGFDLDS